MSETDEQLLDRWRRGETDAGNALFERYFDPLYRFFLHKDVDGDVGDLVQQTMLGVLEGLERFEGRSSVRTHLFAVARHKLYDYWRGRSRAPDIDFGVSSLLDLSPSPSSILRSSERRQLLHSSLRTLPLDQQIALELHYWEELSGPELAKVLDVPEGTVRGRLRRARLRLRDQLLEVQAPRVPSADEELETWLREAVAT